MDIDISTKDETVLYNKLMTKTRKTSSVTLRAYLQQEINTLEPCFYFYPVLAPLACSNSCRLIIVPNNSWYASIT